MDEKKQILAVTLVAIFTTLATLGGRMLYLKNNPEVKRNFLQELYKSQAFLLNTRSNDRISRRMDIDGTIETICHIDPTANSIRRDISSWKSRGYRTIFSQYSKAGRLERMTRFEPQIRKNPTHSANMKHLPFHQKYVRQP